MDPATGRVEVSIRVGHVPHFATPGFGDGMMFVPTVGGVQAFRPVSAAG